MMKLAEAILIGDSYKICKPSVWLSRDGHCGCAFGGALLATGIKNGTELKDMINPFDQYPSFAESEVVKSRWPWVTGDTLKHISRWYYDVYAGVMTIEQLCDKVREIEDAQEVQVAKQVDEAVEELVAA